MKRPLIILAGGKGTRLGDLTKDVPKPMVDIEGKPFLYWLIKKYQAEGFTDITISTGYKAETVSTYVREQKLDVRLEEDKDLSPFPDHNQYYNVNWNPDCIIINGDTWIREPLPTDTDNPWILSCNDIDAGAQFVSIGKIKIYCTPQFFDIGTPSGLETFREYFKTHLVNK